MITVRLYGGLGNQMFQYAAGKALTLRNKDELRFDLDWFRFLGNNRGRSFKLSFLGISEIGLKDRVFLWLSRFGISQRFNYFKEKHFHFDPELLHLKGNIYLDGYWQSEKYFLDFREEIRKDLNFKSLFSHQGRLFWEKIMKQPQSVSLHIRRGDYVRSAKTRAYHGSCSIGYYQRAVEIMRTKLSKPSFFVFSDEVDWVKENFTFEKFEFISGHGLSDYEEMFLMSQCRNQIIANSSFSWWGAWLNQNPDKIVIAPQRWFNNPEIETKDLIPESWLKIPN